MARKVTVSGPITDDGALVEVIVRLTHRQQKEALRTGQPLPERIKVLGMLDPGANRSWVAESLIEKLAVAPLGEDDYRTVGNSSESPKARTYEIGISLAEDERLSVDLAPVGAASNLAAEPFKVILGRDFLTQGRFIYDGMNKRFELRFEAP